MRGRRAAERWPLPAAHRLPAPAAACWRLPAPFLKQVAQLAMPEAGDKQRRERFALSVAYSPDGRRIAAGGMDGSVALFDVATGKLLHTLGGHYKPVRDLTFTPGAARERAERLGA